MSVCECVCVCVFIHTLYSIDRNGLKVDRDRCAVFIAYAHPSEKEDSTNLPCDVPDFRFTTLEEAELSDPSVRELEEIIVIEIVTVKNVTGYRRDLNGRPLPLRFWTNFGFKCS